MQRNLLWFVDIHGPHLYWFDPESQKYGSRLMPEPIGWVLSVRNSERVLVGLKSGLALLEAFDKTPQLEWVDRRFPTDADHRLNDAKADKIGRLWYGSLSMSDESKAVGCFARYEIGNGSPVIIDTAYKIPNGPAFNDDCTVMLHNDSGRRLTYRYAVDAETGVSSEPAIWKRFAEEDGYPDGVNFDADGCVWIAHWGSAKVCRYDRVGNRLLTIDLPTSNVTNICFGGKDMARMFVTTASRGLSNEQRASQSVAGALIEISGLNVQGGPSWQVNV